MLLHGGDFLQGEAKSIYHEDNLCEVDLVIYAELDGADEQEEKDEEAGTGRQKRIRKLQNTPLTSCIREPSVSQALSICSSRVVSLAPDVRRQRTGSDLARVPCGDRRSV